MMWHSTHVAAERYWRYRTSSPVEVESDTEPERDGAMLSCALACRLRNPLARWSASMG